MAPASAQTIIRSALAEFGLEALADWAWNEFLRSGATDVGQAMQIILPAMRERPEYKTRFPAMASLSAKGRAITEADYVAYERSVSQVMRAAGLPEGFYDSPDDFGRFLENELSPAEVQERVQNAQAAIYNASPAIKAQLNELYGVGATPGDVAAFFLDPDVAQPLLTRKLAAARISGQGVESGYGGLSASEAERVAQEGLSDEAIEQGFAQLYAARETFQTQVGAHDLDEEGIGRDEQLGAAFLGDAEAQEKIQREREQRRASFGGGGGGFATGRTGVTGLGNAGA